MRRGRAGCRWLRRRAAETPHNAAQPGQTFRDGAFRAVVGRAVIILANQVIGHVLLLNHTTLVIVGISIAFSVTKAT